LGFGDGGIRAGENGVKAGEYKGGSRAIGVWGWWNQGWGEWSQGWGVQGWKQGYWGLGMVESGLGRMESRLGSTRVEAGLLGFGEGGIRAVNCTIELLY
jgi:hypothetical protein